MVSGAGHDSQVQGRAIPTVMLFVPSRDGRSRSLAKHTPEDQLMPGIRALADALATLGAGDAISA